MTSGSERREWKVKGALALPRGGAAYEHAGRDFAHATEMKPGEIIIDREKLREAFIMSVFGIRGYEMKNPDQHYGIRLSELEVELFGTDTN